MKITRIAVGRHLSNIRISAYECEVHTSGKPVRKRYVRGWYGQFTVERLQSEIIPKLAEYAAARRRSYPFLITTHQLQEKTAVYVPPPKKASDVEFSHRQRKSTQTELAVVLSPKQYKIFD